MQRRNIQRVAGSSSSDIASLFRGEITEVYEDGTVAVQIPKLTGFDQVGPIPVVPLGLQIGERVIVGAVSDSVADLVVLNRIKDKDSQDVPVHTHPVTDLSDASAIGRDLVKAATAGMARGIIGAGTSNLVLGTTSTTAKAGNYQPSWGQVTGKPSTFNPAAHTHAWGDIQNPPIDLIVSGLIPDQTSQTAGALALAVTQQISTSGRESFEHLQATYASVQAGLTPESKGAVADGVTDDEPAIKAAMNTASAIGATVLMNGTYGVDKLTVNIPVTVRGRGTMVKVGAALPTWITTSVDDVDFGGITFDGAGLVNTIALNTVAGIQRFKTRGCRFVNTPISLRVRSVIGADIVGNRFDGSETGVYVTGPTSGRINGNEIGDWVDRGVYLDGTTADGATRDLQIMWNTITGHAGSGNPRHPVQIIGTATNQHQRIKVNYNRVVGPEKSWTAADPGTADQISLHHCVDFEAIGNYSFGGGDMGLTISQECRRGKVHDNICIANDVSGLTLGSAQSDHIRDISVRGNFCFNNGQNRNGDRNPEGRVGIRVVGGINCSVLGNITGDDQTTKTQQYGVSVADSVDIIERDNQNDGNAIGPLYWSNSTRVSSPPEQHTHPASEINDSTTVGRGVLTSATPEAARSILGISDAVAGVMVNVADHGAVADGVTDDSPAFRQALELLRDMGGGILYVPAGLYFCATRFRVWSNVHVIGYGAILRKFGGQATSPDYDFFNVVSGTQSGYGSGANNLHFEGLEFRGDFTAANYRSACAFSFHHAANVVVERCRFVEMQSGGHVFDLGGCEHVTIRDNDFVGYDPVYSNNYHAEAIQIDQSAEGSLSSPDDPASFDGLKTRNVRIENNRFLPLTAHGQTFPAPNPFGSHAQGTNGVWYENVTFIGNHVEDVVDDVSTTYAYKGACHMTHGRNITIRGNTFTQSARTSNRMIGFYTDPARVNMAPRNITIADNTFHNCLTDDAATDEMTLFFGGVAGGEIRDVVVSGNRFTQDLPFTAGNYNMRPENVIGIQVTNNVFSTTQNCGYIPANKNAIWTGNTFTNSATAPVFFGGGDGLTFTGNTIRDCQQGLNFTNITNGSVSGNTVVAETQPGIKVNDGLNISIQGNVVTAGGTETGVGIDIYGSSTNVHAYNNTVTGFTTRARNGTGASSGGNVKTTPNY